MDWVSIATDDWNFYQDTTRIADYVQKMKITAADYQNITGQPYPTA